MTFQRRLGAVLLTGASGFIGAHVLRRLRTRDDVSRILLATRAADPPLPAGASRVESIALDLAADIRLPQGIDTVVHLAGEKRDLGSMHAVNALAPGRLATAAAAAGARSLIHLSSVGVYGAPWRSGRISESTPHLPANAYEQSKDLGERAAVATCRELGLDCVVLQPSNVIGYVRGRSHPLLGFVRAIRRGRFTWFGADDAWTNFVAVEDVAAAVVAAAVATPAGRTCIVNTPAKLATVVGWIAEELALDYPRRRLPRWVGRVGATVGSAMASLSGRAVPFDLPRYLELTNSTVYESSGWNEDMDFAYPCGIERTIRNLVRAYVEDGLT
jgi:nucleoside-diphosphate-sugar epimerase